MNSKRPADLGEALSLEFGELPPIDPEKVARAKGFKVRYATLEEKHRPHLAAFYRRSDNAIVVNRDIPSTWILTAIAHQLGAALLDPAWVRSREYKPFLTSDMKTSLSQMTEKDRDAMRFALHLQAPRRLMERFSEVADIHELSRMFCVPAVLLADHMFELADEAPTRDATSIFAPLLRTEFPSKSGGPEL